MSYTLLASWRSSREIFFVARIRWDYARRCCFLFLFMSVLPVLHFQMISSNNLWKRNLLRNSSLELLGSIKMWLNFSNFQRRNFFMSIMIAKICCKLESSGRKIWNSLEINNWVNRTNCANVQLLTVLLVSREFDFSNFYNEFILQSTFFSWNLCWHCMDIVWIHCNVFLMPRNFFFT